ncbi:MAG: hypothetical protein AB8G11_21265 [Saprospiraceae bacterium]
MQRKFIKNLLLFIFGILTINFTFHKLDSNKPSTKVYKGYVVKESGDTLYGKLQMLNPTMNQVKVKFIDDKGKRMIFKAKDVKSYAFKAQVWNKKEKRNVQEWVYYIKKTVERPPVPFAGNDILMQREVNGNISMYNYYVETRSSQNMEHIIYLEKKDILYTINKTNYRKILKNLMGDYPIVYHKVGTKGYTYKSLTKILKEYNQQTSKQGDNMITVEMD